MRLRYSITRLMALVLLVAIGLAAAMAGAFTFAVVILSEATLCALLRQGPSRTFFAGCAVFGWGFMLLAFGAGREVRTSLPTIRPIVRVFEAVYGPGPTTFKSPEDAGRWLTQMAVAVNGAITTGHSLIALVLALIGGTLTWGVARWWRSGGRRGLAQTVGGSTA